MSKNKMIKMTICSEYDCDNCRHKILCTLEVLREVFLKEKKIEVMIWKINSWIHELNLDLKKDEILTDAAEAIGCINTLLEFIRKYGKA